MDVTSVVKKMKAEINGKNRKDVIDFLEETLIENFEETYKNEDFFQLPLNNIFSVISKIDFHLK